MSLEDLWRQQRAFTGKFLESFDKPFEKLTTEDKVRLTQEYYQYITVEMAEVLGCVNWKRHRFIKPSAREDLVNELVDTQKYLWGLMQVWGITIGELEAAFSEKSAIVDRRFRQEHLLPKLIGDSELVIVDIDDTVANWNDGFERWVSENYPDYDPASYAPNYDPVLRDSLKDRFYFSGGFRLLDPIPEARNAIEQLQSHNYKIVWLTARPITKYPRIEADTNFWLKEHGFPDEYIYYSDLNKHLFIGSQFPLAEAIFDDKPETIMRARKFGIGAYLISDTHPITEAVKEFIGE